VREDALWVQGILVQTEERERLYVTTRFKNRLVQAAHGTLLGVHLEVPYRGAVGNVVELRQFDAALAGIESGPSSLWKVIAIAVPHLSDIQLEFLGSKGAEA
jgi:hypothetical protein